MITLKGDRDGFAGRYECEGHVWKISKVYCGKGIGARWMVDGPFFGKRDMHTYATISGVVKNWKEQGVSGPLA